MKTAITLLSTILLLSLACKKKKNEEEVKPPSIITVMENGKSHQLTVIDQYLKVSDTAELRMFASGTDYKVDIQAKSLNHSGGIGEYFLSCCNNDFWDNSSASSHHECLRGVPVDNIETQKGFLKIISKTDKTFEGTFSMTGQNSEGSIREISGTIKVYY